MIQLEEKDAEWLARLGRNIEVASITRQNFVDYLYHRYEAGATMTLDLGKKAFVEKEANSGE